MAVTSVITNKNVRTFLALIQHTEGTDKYPNPYKVMFTGKTFNDLSKHPNIKNVGGGYTSTAAGAYQFLKRTYDSLGMQNMLPETQDLGAVALIKRRGAYRDVINGRFETAIKKTAKEWASLPTSPYGQPTYTMSKAMAFIKKHETTVGIGFVSVLLFLFSGFFIYKSNL